MYRVMELLASWIEVGFSSILFFLGVALLTESDALLVAAVLSCVLCLAAAAVWSWCYVLRKIKEGG